MSKNQYEGILYLVVSQVVQQIVAKEGISAVSAMRGFYESKVYESLSNERTKLWHFSPLTLYNMYRGEAETGMIDFPVEG